ncbi:hypothetical protein NZD89_12310 [Alicyclobacillus fastidiosus]|uniref:Uncharacterized protein n=1 Tax=Alicyclobacillus fastidiosus TaxID=392011 RepID=A0ABY6ZND4_9BACL|nr:hypothetical protein [Alicyclobacillus fastidiosus]WAH44088.1 hypothetical protein NZD89_12310 [Alicyclobacillus fastidiosus]GMA60381.1 hypothetical protein GCM10025859_08210 [Alicyclobacillus fastidiosus]
MQDLLGSDFDVLAKDEGYFIQELIWVKLFLNEKLSVAVEPPATSDVANWKQCESQAIQTLYTKINQIFEGQTNQENKTNTLVDRMVKDYILGAKVTESIQKDFPILYEKQMSIKSSVESSLEVNSLLTELPPSQFLRQTMDDYREALKSEKFDSIFEFGVVEDLCREAVSDWLIRCPLNFGGV